VNRPPRQAVSHPPSRYLDGYEGAPSRHLDGYEGETEPLAVAPADLVAAEGRRRIP